MTDRYRTALKGYFNRKTPGYMIFFVTPYCNCRCKMCFNMDAILNADRRNVLTFDEIEKITQNLTGLHHMNFSGGEPFLRPDFKDIPGLFYRNSGTRFFTCPTNSSHPARQEDEIRNICEQCPDAWIRISQSLDGVGELHDKIRGRKNLFECVVELNERLAKLCTQYPNLSVGLNMVMSTYNQGHEYEMLDYAYDHLAFNDFGVIYARGETYDPEAKDIDVGSYKRFMETVKARAGEGHTVRDFSGRAFAAIKKTAADLLETTITENRYVTPCLAGKHMVVMNDEGLVEPCEMLGSMIREGKIALADSHLGNIRDFDYDMRKLLDTDKTRATIRYIRKKKCYCSFECAMAVNVLYSPHLWPRVMRELFFNR